MRNPCRTVREMSNHSDKPRHRRRCRASRGDTGGARAEPRRQGGAALYERPPRDFYEEPSLVGAVGRVASGAQGERLVRRTPRGRRSRRRQRVACCPPEPRVFTSPFELSTTRHRRIGDRAANVVVVPPRRRAVSGAPAVGVGRRRDRRHHARECRWRAARQRRNQVRTPVRTASSSARRATGEGSARRRQIGHNRKQEPNPRRSVQSSRSPSARRNAGG